jgi:hypothetical protein
MKYKLSYNPLLAKVYRVSKLFMLIHGISIVRVPAGSQKAAKFHLAAFFCLKCANSFRAYIPFNSGV